MASSIFRRIIAVVFDRQSAKKVEGELEKSLSDAGKKGGDNFLRELRAAFDKRMADLKVQLAKGLIDPAQFKAQSNLAAKEFNAGITKGMEDARKAGTLTEKEYLRLSRTLKKVGDDGATAGDRMKAALTRAGAALAAFFGVRQLLRIGRDLIANAEELSRSQRLLIETLRNVGVEWSAVEHQIKRTTRALWESHRLTGGEVNVGLQALIRTTGNYALSLKNVGLVADVAAAFQLDFEAAAKLIGRVLVGDTAMLKRYGIVVKEGASAMDLLRERTAGAAKANTTATQAMSKAWGDFKEALGQVLLDASRGESIMDRATNTIRTMTDNVGDLVHLVGNLTRAIMVAGLVAGLMRLRTAVLAANAGTVTFLATLRTGWAILGPAGWFVLGVTALTAGFQAMGKAARDAAEEARKGLESFREEATSLPAAQLAAEVAALEDRRDQLEKRIATVRASLTGTGPGESGWMVEKRRLETLTALDRERLEVQGKLDIIEQERRNRANAPRDPDPDPKELTDREKALAAELERINRELAVRRLMIEQGLTEDLAREMVRRHELLTGAVEQIVTSIQEGWKRLDAQDLIRRAGLDKPIIPKVVRGPDREAPIKAWTEEVKVQEQAAKRVEGFWERTFHAIGDDLADAQGLFAGFADAFADESIKGVARLAGIMAKQALANAIRAGAQAIFSFASLNPISGSKFGLAAAKFGAEAAAWSAVAGLGGGGGGGAAASSAGSSILPNPDRGSATERPGDEVHIHFDGPGFDALNPRVQKVVYGSMQQARERFRENSTVRMHRTGG